jgi:hypothetical protein
VKFADIIAQQQRHSNQNESKQDLETSAYGTSTTTELGEPESGSGSLTDDHRPAGHFAFRGPIGRVEILVNGQCRCFLPAEAAN